MSPSDISSAISLAIRSAWLSATSSHLGREEPGVARVVDAGDHPAHGELEARQSRDDQVVLVVAGDCSDHVRLPDADALEHVGIGAVPGVTTSGAVPAQFSTTSGRSSTTRA